MYLPGALANDEDERALTARDGAAFFVCIVIFALNAGLGVATGLTGLAVVTIAMLVVLYRHASTPLGIVALFTGISVFAVPSLALIYVDYRLFPAWTGIYAIAVRLIIAFSPRYDGPSTQPFWVFGNFAALIVWLGLSLALATVELGFYVGWACSLLHLERIHAATKSTIARLVSVGLVILTVVAFTLIFWSGYGRLILSTFALAPLMITLHYRTFRLPVLPFVVGVISLVFLGRVIRFGVGEGIAGLADDSGGSPLTLTQEFFEHQFVVMWTEPFWHQWSLLFLGGVPRSIWPDKPVGINYTLVDAVLGRHLYGEQHSTAVSFIGEQVFLHSHLWPLTTCLLVAVIIALAKAVVRVSMSYIAPLVVVYVWLTSLFWGGMALYGNRLWFCLIPMLIYLWVLRMLGVANARSVSPVATAA